MLIYFFLIILSSLSLYFREFWFRFWKNYLNLRVFQCKIDKFSWTVIFIFKGIKIVFKTSSITKFKLIGLSSNSDLSILEYAKIPFIKKSIFSTLNNTSFKGFKTRSPKASSLLAINQFIYVWIFIKGALKSRETALA